MRRIAIQLLLVLAALSLGARSARAQHDSASEQYSIPISPVVTLTWNASTSSGVVSYNVYWSGVHGGPYSILGSVPASGPLTYQDLDVTSGSTYYYVVTAVNSSGEESTYSNEATVSLPAQ
jgi:fibronectin type 3 domain-containing protein